MVVYGNGVIFDTIKSLYIEMNKIELCKKCKKRKFDLKQGVVCGLTNEKPTFEESCVDFETDETVKEYSGMNTRPNRQRAKTLLVLIWIVLGLEILSLISGVLQYNLIAIVANGGEITNEEALANDLREQIVGILYLIAYVASGIAFIMWFRRAYFNLHQKVRHLSFSEGWAAGCWFVPIVNLFRPYQIMKELYDETKRYILDKDYTVSTNLTTKFLGLWWTLWIINGILGQVIFRYSSNAETVSELMNMTTLDIIGSVIGIPLGFVTLKIIKDYSDAEGSL